MDRRVVVVGAGAGLVAMVGAWVLLGQGSGHRSRRDRVERPTVAGPVRLPAEHRVGRAELRPDLAARLRPGRQPATAPAEAPAPPADGAPFPMDQDGLEAAVATRRADLEACHQTARYHTPELPASMTLLLAVVPDPGAGAGHIESVKVASDLDASVFEGCAAAVLADLRFATTEPTTVRYPLSLAASDGAEAIP